MILYLFLFSRGKCQRGPNPVCFSELYMSILDFPSVINRSVTFVVEPTVLLYCSLVKLQCNKVYLLIDPIKQVDGATVSTSALCWLQPQITAPTCVYVTPQTLSSVLFIVAEYWFTLSISRFNPLAVINRFQWTLFNLVKFYLVLYAFSSMNFELKWAGRLIFSVSRNVKNKLLIVSTTWQKMFIRLKKTKMYSYGKSGYTILICRVLVCIFDRHWPKGFVKSWNKL